MLALANRQPRLDRVLARAFDLVVYGLVGFLSAFRVLGERTDDALSSGETLALAIVTVLVVAVCEVGPLIVRKPSPGKQLFALQVDSAAGGMASVPQMLRRAIPLSTILVVFIVSLRTSIQIWWLTLGLGLLYGLVGLLCVIRDRPTPWDRLAGTRVVPVPAGR